MNEQDGSGAVEVHQIHGDCLYIPGKAEGGLGMRYLLDTGASDNFLSRSMFNQLPRYVREKLSQEQLTASTANGGDILIYGSLDLNCKLRGLKLPIPFRVANIAEDAILGMGFLQDHKCHLDLDQGLLMIGEHVLQCVNRTGLPLSAKIQVRQTVTLPAASELQVTCRLTQETAHNTGMTENLPTEDLGVRTAASLVTVDNKRRLVLRCINPHAQPVTLNAGTTVGTFSAITADQVEQSPEPTHSQPQPVNLSADLPVPAHLTDLYEQAVQQCTTTTQRSQLASLLCQYSSVFSAHDTDVGRTDLITHSIPTQEGAAPIKQPPRRLGPEKDAEVERQVRELVDKVLVEPADSAWSSPVVLVKKRCGSWRLCIDYRRLNQVTRQDAYPLPRIDDSLDALSGAVYFSTLDLISGYWQVPLDQEAQEKAAFVTRGGLWRWKVLPFGLTSAPATFERLMERVLHGLQWKTLLLYLDDVIIFSPDFSTHLERLETVLQRLAKAKLKLKPSKCALLQSEVKYLGHVVSRHGVATDPEKVEAVKEWTTPRCQTELRTFLGFVGYYRRFCPDFASIAKPLHKLTAKGVPFLWTEIEQEAYDKLRQFLIEAPVLAYPEPGTEFILDTDASLEGVGGVLSQVQQGQERVIAYYSKTLSPAERNYCVTRRELLAVVMAAKHFRPYLYGRPFKLRTDHASLRWLYKLKDPHHQVARWLEILSEFRFELEHRAGRLHENADGLSRKECTACKQCDSITKRDSGESESQEMVQTDGPITQQLTIKDPLSKEVVKLQQTPGSDVQLLYDTLLSGQQLAADAVEQGSWELRKLAGMTDVCRLQNGVLQVRLQQNGRERWVTICPKELRPTVIRDTHIQHHAGINKTYRRLLLNWYWPGMSGDIRRAVNRCEVCQMAKISRKQVSGNQKRLFSGRPWQVVAIDLVGPFVTTPRGNKMVLVLSDHFSRWRDAIAIPDGTAETVARVLDGQVFAYLGLPERIHSDQGAQFESTLFKELCALWGIQKSRTTAYHPQGNGMVERGNRELGDSLRSLLLARAEDDWDLLLPQIMRSIRATPHTTTGETPNYLMYGREMRLPDNLLGSVSGETTTRPEYAEQVKARLEEAHDYLRHQQSQVRTADKQAAPLYKSGDLVWLINKRYRKGTTPKLQPKYNGPYKVIQTFDNNTYQLELKGKKSVENESRLKLYSPATAHWGQAPEIPEATRQPPRMGGRTRNARPSNGPSPEELILPDVSPRELENRLEADSSSEKDSENVSANEEENAMETESPLSENEETNNLLPEETTPPVPVSNEASKKTARRRTAPSRLNDYVLYNVVSPRLRGQGHIKVEGNYNSNQSQLTLHTIRMAEEECCVVITEEGELPSDSSAVPAPHPSTSESTSAVEVTPKEKSEADKEIFAGCSSTYQYVHKDTERRCHAAYQKAKSSRTCPYCHYKVTGKDESLRRHIWDHFAVCVCECGVWNTRYDGLSKHRRVHMGKPYRYYKVDSHFYHVARDRLSDRLPRHYPGDPYPKYLDPPTPREDPRAAASR